MLGEATIGVSKMRLSSWVRGMEGFAPSLERRRRKALWLSILSLISVSRDMEEDYRKERGRERDVAVVSGARRRRNIR